MTKKHSLPEPLRKKNLSKIIHHFVPQPRRQFEIPLLFSFPLSSFPWIIHIGIVVINAIYGQSEELAFYKLTR